MPPSLTSLRRHCCFSRIQVAEKHLLHAQQLISTGKRDDVESAIAPLDSALELYPTWEKALELKARGLLYLKRFKDVVEMLHEFLPSLNNMPLGTVGAATPPESPILSKEKARFLSHSTPHETRKRLSVASLRQKLSSSLHKGPQTSLVWRYLILGQACCHLGMMEDAMVLLQSSKKTASAASRSHSNGMRDDNFCSDSSHVITSAAELDLVNHMIANIKLLLRRREAALAALEAGLYSESVRHFSKIIEGQKGTPPGFIADCYLHRAVAYQAIGRVVDAIADCNRNLALNPRCTKALSVRASLHEMVKSFSECLLDLQQLKMIYEASLRYQTMAPESMQWDIRQRNSSDINISGGLDYINSKIMATRRRLCHGTCLLDARTILDMPENCSMEDVEKAYLLLSLKHSPDKAALFVDNCLRLVQQDGCRDMETVKEEAKASALRLSKLIHKAYTKLLSAISEDEAEEHNELCTSVEGAHYATNMRCWPNYEAPKSQFCAKSEAAWHPSPINGNSVDDVARMSCIAEEDIADDEDRISCCNEEKSADDLARISGSNEGEIAYDEARISTNDEIRELEGVCAPNWESQGDNGDQRALNSFSVDQKELIRGHGNGAGDKKAIKVVLEAFTGFEFSGNDMANSEKLRAFTEEKQFGEFCQLMSSHGGFSSTALASVISQVLSNENPILARRWLGTTDWSLPHSQPLSVT